MWQCLCHWLEASEAGRGRSCWLCNTDFLLTSVRNSLKDCVVMWEFHLGDDLATSEASERGFVDSIGNPTECLLKRLSKCHTIVHSAEVKPAAWSHWNETHFVWCAFTFRWNCTEAPEEVLCDTPQQASSSGRAGWRLPGAERVVPPAGAVLRGCERRDTATEVHCRVRHWLLQLLGPFCLLHQRGLQ